MPCKLLYIYILFTTQLSSESIKYVLRRLSVLSLNKHRSWQLKGSERLENHDGHHALLRYCRRQSG